ncbi:hypothetical protein D9613_005215 [Agrocybe pediades]|uniref:FCP1 homology domain-containing protein n=1 Tax=Agrocybe pediades TaxID=84607 RepID=A0A8H4QXW8_9AGAR|nr:hypothetical protein D9613_005215 [Agrocybe pediades]
MNTLGYVARQFDVLASSNPSNPPNKPPNARIPRVSTWSILFPGPPMPSVRRSQSSPILHPQQSTTDTLPPSTSPTTPPSPPTPTLSKVHLDTVIDQIFFIRVFLLVWDHLKSAWQALFALIQPLPPAAPATTASPEPEPENVHTPPPVPKKTPFHLPKTLVLDLDETLIHSTSRPIPYQPSGSGLLSLGSFGKSNKPAGHMVEVVLGGRSTLYHVYKRPFVDFFLRTVSSWYTLVIFTASMQEYADPVIDWLDAGRGILEHRFFRDSCTQLPNGSYTKDLTIVDPDLSRVCLVDNSPISYSTNEANGIPIEGWTHDPSDEALLDLLPVLDSLRFTSDVRRVLGLRSAGIIHQSPNPS